MVKLYRSDRRTKNDDDNYNEIYNLLEDGDTKIEVQNVE